MTDVFPESAPKPIYPLVVEPVFSTNVVDLGAGNEQRRSNWLYPKFDVTVQYHALKASDAQVLWSFFVAHRGAYGGFFVYDLALLADAPFAHSGLYCGTGDGETTIFDIPGRATSDQTVYLDGIAESAATVLVGGGDGGADRVSFPSPPDPGMVASVDFTGFLRIRARFAQDRISRELFLRNLFTYGAIQLKGLGAR